MKLWIATAVDTSDSADGKARVIGTFKNQEDAYEFVTSDIQKWVEDNPNDDAKCDFCKMKTWLAFNDSIGCEWNVEEVEVK